MDIITYPGETFIVSTRAATSFLCANEHLYKILIFSWHRGSQCWDLYICVQCLRLWNVFGSYGCVFTLCFCVILCKDELQLSSEILRGPFSMFLIKNVYLPYSHSKGIRNNL